MNATKICRRSDSLYYGNISRRELCDMVAHLESDLQHEKKQLECLTDAYRRLVDKDATHE